MDEFDAIIEELLDDDGGHYMSVEFSMRTDLLADLIATREHLLGPDSNLNDIVEMAAFGATLLGTIQAQAGE